MGCGISAENPEDEFKEQTNEKKDETRSTPTKAGLTEPSDLKENKIRYIDFASKKPDTDVNDSPSSEVTTTECNKQEICRTYPSSNSDPNKLTILHFNDVYNIESRDEEPVGGAARFVTKVRSFPNNPLVLFSGDCLNPSLISSVTRGQHMAPILNAINVHAAVYGNHDFDFGVDTLIEFKNKSNFPWLISNVKDKLSNTLLGEGIESVIAEWHGKKIGIIGLIEEEWLVTLATIDPEDVEYVDFIECARKLVPILRNDEACDLIIALTHMRVPNDLKLLQSDIDIDLVLGGHDHHYETQTYKKRTFVKSGTDFRDLSEITVDFSENNNPTVTVKRHDVTSDIAEDEHIKEECQKVEVLFGEKMEEELGSMCVEMDGRFCTVRTKESNLGNFICDIVRTATQADIAVLNSGTFRSDRIHPVGSFKKKDLVSILPMPDPILLLSLTGRTILEVLENSVSQYPRYEGRFLQVSGISFTFHPEKAPGERICKESVLVSDDTPISMDQEYTVATKEYMVKGKDGYDMISSCKVLVDAENGPILLACVENHFESIRIYKGRRQSVTGHRQSVVMRNTEVKSYMEQQRSKLSPQVEGRIKQVGEEKRAVPTHMRKGSKLFSRLSRASSIKIIEGTSFSLEDITEQYKRNKDDEEDDEIKSQYSDSDIDLEMEGDEGLEKFSEEGQMILWEACLTDDLAKIESIVSEKTFDFNFWVTDKTLLHHASQHNATKCIEFLLKTNLDVNVRDKILKGTPLFYAAEFGCKEAGTLLIDNGAKVNAKNSLWETPLHVACKKEQSLFVIMLLNRGADKTVKNKEGNKPAIYAIPS